MFMNVRHACLQCALLKSSFNRKISTTLWLLRRKRNYYEILGVKNDSTQKEIKDAYIHLSKIHHPDRKSLHGGGHGSKEDDKEFKKIVVAYQILSRPHSRTNYDNHLKGVHNITQVYEDIVHRPYESGDKRYNPVNEDNYYGIKGVKKMAHWKIVLACVIFCLTGVIIQIMAISHSITFKREILVKKSAEFNKNHQNTRLEALSNTNDDNLLRVLSRMKKDDE